MTVVDYQGFGLDSHEGMTMVRTWWIRGRIAVLSVAVLGAGAACHDPVAADGDTNIRLRNASVDGLQRTLVPVDYVGENYIGDGRFTYVITIDPATRNPSVSLVED